MTTPLEHGDPFDNPFVALARRTVAEGLDETQLQSAVDALPDADFTYQSVSEAVQAIPHPALSFREALILSRLASASDFAWLAPLARGIIFALFAQSWQARAERDGPDAAQIAARNVMVARPLLIQAPQDALALLADIGMRAGNSLQQVRRYEAAIAAYREAEALLQTLTTVEPVGYALDHIKVLTNLGATLDKRGSYREAMLALEKAWMICSPLAEQYWAQYAPYLATIQHNLGNVLYQCRAYNEAVDAYEACLALRRKLVTYDPVTYTRDLVPILNNLGAVRSDQRAYAEALDAYEEARAIYAPLAVSDPATYAFPLAMLLNNIGNAWYHQRSSRKAIQVYEEARKLCAPLASRDPETYAPDLAFILSNLGAALSDQRHYAQAITVLREAWHIYAPLAEHDPATFEIDLATVLMNLGYVLFDGGAYAEAIRVYEKARAIYTPLAKQGLATFALAVATILNNLGNTLRSSGDVQAAEERYRQALTLCDELAGWDGGQRPDVVAIRVRVLAQLGRLSNDLVVRRGFFTEALTLLEDQRRLLAHRDDRQIFQREFAALYGDIVGCCLALAKTAAPDARRELFAEAWHWSERGRGRALLDLLGSPRPRLETPDQRGLFEQWQEALRTVDRRLHEFRQGQPGGNDGGMVVGLGGRRALPALDREQLDAERRLRWDELREADRAEEELRRRVFLAIDGARQLAQPEIPSPEALTASLARLAATDGAAVGARPLLVEYALLPGDDEIDRYAVFLAPLWATRDRRIAAKTVELPGGELQRLLSDLAFARDLGADSASDEKQEQAKATWAGLPARLGALLVRPWVRWLDRLKPTALVVVAEGPLQGLPLHAAEIAAGLPLIARYPLVTLPTAALAGQLVERAPQGGRGLGAGSSSGPHTYDKAPAPAASPAPRRKGLR
ncbi:MAG: tetratricopeptide repeat protein [Chloroflexia bacterium]